LNTGHGKKRLPFSLWEQSPLTSANRQSTGIAALDSALGGGLIPGTLTVIVGATGIGKTQLGVQYLDAGKQQDGQRGIVLDFTARGDSQNHANYAKRISAWELTPFEPPARESIEILLNQPNPGDYLPVVVDKGRNVSRSQMSEDEWRDWQAEWNREMYRIIAFLYAGFIHGRRRVLIDGIEPTGAAADSAQLHLFEHLYHKVIQQEPQWVARELFREHFRRLEQSAAAKNYAPASIGSLMLITTTELMLDPLIDAPAAKKHLIANANTVILMGKTRQNGVMGRALYIAKHRGSACRDEILPFTIGESGLQLGG
jgi:KaiC/GvpD/RAD55 family RecA-like ATPase